MYHSRTTGAQQMAEAAHAAAKEETEALIQRGEDTNPEDLLAANGYIFAAPENLTLLPGTGQARRPSLCANDLRWV